MAQGISFHFGVNRVDPGYYQENEILYNCENDAKLMQGIARSKGFVSTLFLTQEATSTNLFQSISTAAATLQAGDILLITFAGHGIQSPDNSGTEADGKNENWVMYDRPVVDDDLYKAFKQIKSNVRVLVISDSCHSGTVTQVLTIQKKKRAHHNRSQKVRLLSRKTYKKIKKKYTLLYQEARDAVSPKQNTDIVAAVLLLAASQDDQLASDGIGTLSTFTDTLNTVWNGGAFNGDYQAFLDTIVARMPVGEFPQTPNYFFYGNPAIPFQSQIPFTI